MIKVPATVAGIQALERLIAAGINVNLTLLFAVAAYEQGAEAYLRGLERRLDEGETDHGDRERGLVLRVADRYRG